MPHAERFTIDTVQKHGDWRDDLFRDGFVVLKGLISMENSERYIQDMFSWLEKFPFGFDRNDEKTWTPEYLPTHMKEPKVIEAFEKLWGTKDLLVSFDGMNFTLPSHPRPATEPWPHIDQSPTRLGLQCVQGILNFAPNGPQDGGLMVLKGSHKLSEEFFSAHDGVLGRKTWGPSDWFGFQPEEVEWFKGKGCELLKVCAGVGDVILWDSRTVHYNVLPESENIRALISLPIPVLMSDMIDACYTPASFAAPDDLGKKAELFDQRKGTTHWPHANIFPNDEKKLRLGKPDVNERERPFEEPEMNDTILKLAGRLAY
ncbi:hypothetical protein LSUB1_G000401 [Lachnellula subtilissima]|uniref:Phytanoyl-CoA dioxygenase n=1 Tax=Lachnellula subtilissima TaxID=602034 RepID=A0A8H8S300_9HELO|nr:hypothetical protein LSUB1_G000401 [Lachnellula subtilissima]